MQKYILFVVVFWGCFASRGVETSRPPEGTQERAYVERCLAEIKDKHIRVNGKVVDEEGNIIPDVRIEVLYNKTIMFYGYRFDTKKSILPDGRFSLDVTGYTEIDLYFRKDGFFSSPPFTFKLRSGESQEERMGGVRYSQEYDDVVIVMRATGKFAKTSFSNVIWSNLPVNALDKRVLDFDTLKVVRLDAEEEKPASYFFVTQGEPYESPADWDPPYHYILNLHSDRAEDGLIAVPDAKGMRDLAEAPEEGYAPLEIPLLFSPKSTNDRCYYFRRGDQYGKMLVCGITMSRDRTVMRLQIYFVLNKETDSEQKRNVRARSDQWTHPVSSR